MPSNLPITFKNTGNFFIFLVLIPFFMLSCGTAKNQNDADAARALKHSEKLAHQVIIKRTDYGVPHIKADNLKAAGYALGYVQMEDYAQKVINALIEARGEWTKYHEVPMSALDQKIDQDVAHKIKHKKAVKTWPQLDRDTRDMVKGFTAGVNRYIELHSNELADWVNPFFTVYDVQSAEIEDIPMRSAHKFLHALRKRQAREKEDSADSTALSAILSNPQSTAENTTLWMRLAANYQEPPKDIGSNTWAFAPGRTRSGHAILMRNPHLYWDAGYYEAQVHVPGKFNFYGDFRIGAPLITVGGFNEHLGWSTTNNNSFMDEIYSFKADPKKPDHYLLDGQSKPLQRKTIKVEFKNGTGLGEKRKEVLTTTYGPVLYRGNGEIYILRSAAQDVFKGGEQYLKMMKANSLSEWKQAMRTRGIITSNFTYADDAGNIFYVWNGTVPDLPEKWGGDTTATLATKSDQIWTDLIKWDDLPHLKNPAGGYLHNENDSFHFTNLNEILDKADYPDYFPEPLFRLRSQKSYELIHHKDQKLSLEDVVKLKYNTGMLLADRVKGDLIKAIKKTNPKGEPAKAMKLLKNWDNKVNRDSKGAVLFKIWWDRYLKTAKTKDVKSSPESVGFYARADELFKKVWSSDKPVTTPYGLADMDRAAQAFKWAIGKTKERYGSWDVSWGQVHRALAKNKNVAANGCPGLFGCFRVFWYGNTKIDGKNRRKVKGGDGWVLAVEFGQTPKAYSVLAYGESEEPDSPFYYDQLKLFMNKKMKPVAFEPKTIEKQLIKEYRPGIKADSK